MSPLVRRVAARVILASGVAAIAIMLARSCERHAGEVTVVVDTRRAGDAVRSARVEVFRDDRSLAWAERRYDAGFDRGPLRLRLPRPDGPVRVVIDLETRDGPRQIERVVDQLDADATVTIRVGSLAESPETSPDPPPADP